MIALPRRCGRAPRPAAPASSPSARQPCRRHFPRTSQQLGRGHRVQHSCRSPETAGGAGNRHQSRRSEPQAEGDLQSHRKRHPARPGAGPDGGLGAQAPPGHRGSQHPRPAPGGRRPRDVGRLHGRAARSVSSWSADDSPAPFSPPPSGIAPSRASPHAEAATAQAAFTGASTHRRRPDRASGLAIAAAGRLRLGRRPEHPPRHGVELGEQRRIARLRRGHHGVLQRPVGADRAWLVLARKIADQPEE